jgi:hypothetical protein
MRRLSLVAVVAAALIGCGDEGEGSDVGPSFQLVTPVFDVEPGGELTYCYYTRLGNETPVGVRRWRSRMTAGSHHLILFRTQEPLRPDDTLEPCGGFGGDFRTDGFASLPIWTYAAQEPEVEQRLPEGVGMALEADQPMIIQMHYFNTTAETLRPEIVIDVDTYAPDADIIPAGPYITFHPSIEVEPHDTGFVEGNCPVPAGAQFFSLSTHSHRFTTTAEVWDGDRRLVLTEDWEHPEEVHWDEAPFQEFSNPLRYRCDYENDTDTPVTTGSSAETDEMCMAVGYYFPNDGFNVCLGSTMLSL